LIAATAAILMLVAGWAWFANSDTTGFGQLDALESDQLAAAWVESLVVMDDEELDSFIEKETPINDWGDDESDMPLAMSLNQL
jgi:hypothetical protein